MVRKETVKWDVKWCEMTFILNDGQRVGVEMLNGDIGVDR